MSSPVRSRQSMELYNSYESSEVESLIADEEDLNCAICFGKIHALDPSEFKTFKKRVKAIFLKKHGERYLYINKCKHYFHQSCLLDWFESCKGRKQKQNCPACRTVVKKIINPGCLSFF